MPTPVSLQGFTLDAYFNSTGTDPVETPHLSNGIVLPPSALWGSSGQGVKACGQGVKAWRREWRAKLPQPSNYSVPFWNPGIRIFKAKASTGRNANYFQANNDTLTINAWDLQGPSSNPPVSTVTNAFVQLTAYYINASGVQTFLDPSTIFTQYCWGLYNSANLAAFPAPTSGNGNCSSLSQAAANPVQTIQIGAGQGVGGGNHFQASPNTAEQMNVGAVATLLFQQQIPATPGNATLKIQITLFLTLTPASGPSVYGYDDPEMDVDCT